ncbi:MAG: hypothetical protein J4F36_05485 [Nitrosopumilaceae archaeon]|nr:hypothetical protein [Nitrosopumilaceae archaeon]
MMNFRSTIKRILVVIGVSFVMVTLLLLTSNKLYILGEELPYQVIYGTVIIGIVGCVFYLIDKTPLRYLVVAPPVVMAFLIMLRADPY